MSPMSSSWKGPALEAKKIGAQLDVNPSSAHWAVLSSPASFIPINHQPAHPSFLVHRSYSPDYKPPLAISIGHTRALQYFAFTTVDERKCSALHIATLWKGKCINCNVICASWLHLSLIVANILSVPSQHSHLVPNIIIIDPSPRLQRLSIKGLNHPNLFRSKIFKESQWGGGPGVWDY